MPRSSPRSTRPTASTLAWTRLTSGSVAASTMSRLLAEHDRLVVAAAERGRDAKYAEAIKVLDEAEAQIADGPGAARQAGQHGRRLGPRRVARRATPTYDVALREPLQGALEGRQEDHRRRRAAAVAAEAAARAQLPPDTRGLVVIMAEIGRGGMNGAVIAIEEARAKLADALEAGTAAPSDGPASHGPVPDRPSRAATLSAQPSASPSA